MEKINPLRIIECSGSEYEIGRQYGEQARDNIAKAVSLMFGSLKLMPYRAERCKAIMAAKDFEPNVRSFDPEALERIHGIADGSSLTYNEVFTLQCYSELFVNYPGIAGLCTSFGLTGQATKDGLTILGQNVDWHPDSTIDLLRIRRKDGMTMLGLFLNGYCSFYLNSAGVGNCANLTLCPMGPVTNHVPFAFYLYSAMQRQRAQEALDLLRRTARGIGYIHVADKTGFLAGVESIYDDSTVIEPGAGVLVHANHYEAEQYKKFDAATTYIPDSFTRANRLRACISETYGTITPENMMAYLQDHAGGP